MKECEMYSAFASLGDTMLSAVTKDLVYFLPDHGTLFFDIASKIKERKEKSLNPFLIEWVQAFLYFVQKHLYICSDGRKVLVGKAKAKKYA